MVEFLGKDSDAFLMRFHIEEPFSQLFLKNLHMRVLCVAIILQKILHCENLIVLNK